MISILIRHALTPAQDRLGQRAGIALSEAGAEQAARLAERLRPREIAAVFSSPLTRAMETAAAVAGPRGLAVIPDLALREVETGDWDGRAIGDLSVFESWKYFNIFRSGTRCPGGEMMIEVQARVAAFLERAAREYRDAAIAVVSHADVIRAAVCHYLAIPLDLSLRVQISPASVTTLRLHECGAEVLGLNRCIE